MESFRILNPNLRDPLWKTLKLRLDSLPSFLILQ
jgi:hypothetical protein